MKSQVTPRKSRKPKKSVVHVHADKQSKARKKRMDNRAKVELIKLFRARTDGESQNRFCARHGVNSSTFSKWINRFSDLLDAAPEASLARRRLEHRAEKDAIRLWATEEVLQGRRVDVHSILAFAEASTPSLFSSAPKKNSRYVACFRLLRDLAPELHLRELDMVSSSLLSLREERRDLSHVERPATYFHQEQNTFVGCDAADFEALSEAFCVCTGSVFFCLFCICFVCL